MRALTFATAIFVAGAAYADKDKPDEAVEAAKATIGKVDEAFNAHDAKAFLSYFDKDVLVYGPTTGAKHDGLAAWKEYAEKMLAQGGRLMRQPNSTVVKADADGNTAWYVADYTFVPKVPPGALPVHRAQRESGVLVKRGKDWKFSLVHVSFLQPDQMVKPLPPPPVK